MSEVDWANHSVRGINSAKRCSIVRTGWMGDWFTSHSPRNDNENAEGPWCHWVELALSILQHPATAELRPEIHAAVKDLEQINYYDEGPRFSDEDMARLFPSGADR